jgi:MPBQ/MSBQ methyltransferase
LSLTAANSTDLNYDILIFNPVMRALYGGSGYFNVGYWAGGAQTQEQSCRDMVDRLLSPVKETPARVLDVACGLGGTTQQMKERWPQAEVTGVNISAQQVEACRQRVLNCDFQVMDAASMSFENESFDVILCVEAAMHFHSRQAFLQEAFRLLKPGGFLLLTDMLVSDPERFKRWRVPAENYIPDEADYRARMAQAGFTAIDVQDQLQACWLSWCNELDKWIDNAQEIDGQRRLEQLRAASETRRSQISHYLLVSAMKTA